MCIRDSDIARRYQALLANLEQLWAGDTYDEFELLWTAGDPGRSRQGAQTQQRRQKREPGPDSRLCPLAGPQRDGTSPVSYTHLDVYKRQGRSFGICFCKVAP